jgi:hypothetical protein
MQKITLKVLQNLARLRIWYILVGFIDNVPFSERELGTDFLKYIYK